VDEVEILVRCTLIGRLIKSLDFFLSLTLPLYGSIILSMTGAKAISSSCLHNQRTLQNRNNASLMYVNFT